MLRLFGIAWLGLFVIVGLGSVVGFDEIVPVVASASVVCGLILKFMPTSRGPIGPFSKYNRREGQLVDELTEGFRFGGASSREAKALAIQFVDEAIAEAKASGIYEDQGGRGSTVLAAMSAEDKNRLTLEGVSSDDILWWWNMSAVDRLVWVNQSEASRLGMFLQRRASGDDDAAAALAVKRTLPMYGYVSDDKVGPQDQPLPFELGRRISEHMRSAQLRDGLRFKDTTDKFTTINAYLRHKIRQGDL